MSAGRACSVHSEIHVLFSQVSLVAPLDDRAGFCGQHGTGGWDREEAIFATRGEWLRSSTYMDVYSMEPSVVAICSSARLLVCQHGRMGSAHARQVT